MSKKKYPDKVIWITTDHMRYDCVSANGNPNIHTPNLDFLTNNGVSFDNCFGQNPLCMPSRTSFMTGLYPQQVGVTTNGHCLRPDFEPVVAKCFKAGDYTTAQIGKLHFQPHEDNDLDSRSRYDYGFDKLWLAEEPGPYEDAYMTWLRTEYPDLVKTFRVKRPMNPDRNARACPTLLDAPWQASFSGWVVEQTKRHLGGFGGGMCRDKEFVHMGFYAPHPPLNPTKEMFAPYRDAEIPLPNFQQNDETVDKPPVLTNIINRFSDWDDDKFIRYRDYFYAMVTGVDMAVGELLEFLRKRGELDNTLIVFSSDHGDMCGDHSTVSKHESFYDEIMHLPLILHWPDGLGTEPRQVAGMVEMVDLLPTMLGLCNIAVPRVMKGIDFSEELLQHKLIKGRDNVLAYHSPGHIMLRDMKYKYIRYADDGEVLYDLENDPGEIVNQASNPDYLDVLNTMRYKSLARVADACDSPQPLYFCF